MKPIRSLLAVIVLSVFIMAALGLKDAGTGLMCCAILLISTSVGCDMQQDRSTGWRLGTNRTIQFRFQVAGIVMGAIMAVVLLGEPFDFTAATDNGTDNVSVLRFAQAFDLDMSRINAKADRILGKSK